MKRCPVSAVGVAAVIALAGSAYADSVVGDWQTMYLQALRQAPFAGPGAMARSGAIMNTAIFNAVNAIDGTHIPYGGFNFDPAANASKKAAVAYAAHSVLTTLYSGEAGLIAQFDATLASSIAGVPEPDRAAAEALGIASANHILGVRAGDGHDADPSYTPGVNPGDWQPTQAGPAVHPHWGSVTPWGIASGDQFRPNRLSNYGSMANFLASDEYRDAYNDVKQNGRIDSWTPADEEYQIAFFWGNDRGGTYHPPGHLIDITKTMTEREFAGMAESDRISQEARLFALVGVAMADAGIAAWDCKFKSEFDLWRPITAIQAADDGNPDTITDPTWEPLNHVDPDGPGGPMVADPFSPQFPAYVSGHATFGAAHAKIMELFFGGDEIAGGPLEIGTDDPYVPGLTRTFMHWSDMALENGRSRVYLGVHWQFDADDGYTMGSGVGDWIFNNYFVEVPTPGALALLSMTGVLIARRRR